MPPDPGQPIMILLVEDDSMFQQVISFGLKSCGYSVVTADNGADGLEHALGYKFDFVLTDLLMPVMDGLEFATQVKEVPLYRDVPIVLMTGRKLDGQLAEQTVFADMLTKPFTLDELSAVVERLRK